MRFQYRLQQAVDGRRADAQLLGGLGLGQEIGAFGGHAGARLSDPGEAVRKSRLASAAPGPRCSRGVQSGKRSSSSGAAGASSLSPVDAALLAWFWANGRDLPWRSTRDPYAILVSEVMLQQTQVERVVPRYLAWLERWPTPEALAAAPLADVIREWQGLGYNRRAVNLHRAAHRIAADGWPADLTELPGVGRYTADAVAAFAHRAPVLPEDTNVRRVQARTAHRFGPECAQALMDLGATVCLARVPRCGACPLARACPSRGRRYEPQRRQGRFEGSFRQRRARVLRAVTEEPRAVSELDSEAVAALERDGLVAVADGSVRLP